ncbi:MAG: hypothetical protein JXR64_06745 [Spirochaetales bacterium]|nr:hypothetical protein [Spirochaetales bacterium]
MKKILVILFMLVALTLSFANGAKEASAQDGDKTFTIFMGYEKENYPTSGTIFGNWLEEQTGVKLNWEILVGDLKQKVGIMAASGDYPDLIAARNQTYVLHEAGAFIPLNKLLEEHGQDILKLWGEEGVKMIRQADGEIYWLPQTMPYGTKVRKTQEAHAFYMQKAVLEYFNYKLPKNVEEAMAMLTTYAETYPEINGNKTFAFTALNDGWREYALLNAPHIFSGHPNDGKANVEWVNGKWQVSMVGFDDATYKIYKIYNDVYKKGFYDVEAFVMSNDQYQAKLTTGSILGFYDQWWNFTQAQTLLKEQGEGRWYIPVPVVMDGYVEEFEGPIEPQSTEGLGISVSCKDPVAVIKYLNFLAKEETLKMRFWGRENIDYLVEADGLYTRNQEQNDRFRDQDWRNKTFGADYWSNFLMPNMANFFKDGKNSIAPNNQPSIYRAQLLPEEVEALDALKIDTFFDLFRTPNPKRALYFPAWSINYPTGSDIAITEQKVADVRRKYTPLLVTAAEGDYDKIWAQYIAEYKKIPKADIDAMMGYLQKAIDERVAVKGGY